MKRLQRLKLVLFYHKDGKFPEYAAPEREKAIRSERDGGQKRQQIIYISIDLFQRERQQIVS